MLQITLQPVLIIFMGLIVCELIDLSYQNARINEKMCSYLVRSSLILRHCFILKDKFVDIVFKPLTIAFTEVYADLPSQLTSKHNSKYMFYPTLELNRKCMFTIVKSCY